MTKLVNRLMAAAGVVCVLSEVSHAEPSLGGHTIASAGLHGSQSSLSSSLIATQASGGTMLVMVAMGTVGNLTAPADNMGNTFTRIGAARTYREWPSSGMALYVGETLRGGPNHAVTVPMPKRGDEVTMTVTEIRNADGIQSVAVSEVPRRKAPYTSGDVTTTGPAVLVATWWGDAAADRVTATPNNGFTVIDSVLQADGWIQCVVAMKEVSTAGTYNVSWTHTPSQGCVLWLVAVGSSPRAGATHGSGRVEAPSVHARNPLARRQRRVAGALAARLFGGKARPCSGRPGDERKPPVSVACQRAQGVGRRRSVKTDRRHER